MTRAYRGILPALLLLMALLLFGCGGGGSSPSANPTPTPAPSRMEIIDTEPLTGFTNTSAVNREMTLQGVPERFMETNFTLRCQGQPDRLEYLARVGGLTSTVGRLDLRFQRPADTTLWDTPLMVTLIDPDGNEVPSTVPMVFRWIPR
jgi:hypothetical protein